MCEYINVYVYMYTYTETELYILTYIYIKPSVQEGFPGGSAVKNLPAMQEIQEIWIQPLSQEDSLEEGMATHSSILARKIP